MARFDGMTVLLTGATGGFGEVAARRFAEEGANLVLSDREWPKLETLAAALSCETALLAGDVAAEETSEALVRLAMERFGRLDVAVNNAGVGQSQHRIHELSSEEARRIIDIDLMGVFYAMKHQLPVMLDAFARDERRGAIVNVASVAGLGGAPKLGVYAAAKHGVVGLTKSAAVEYASRGIRLNAVCPAFSRTPMVSEIIARDRTADVPDAAIADLLRSIPMRRLGEPEDVVEAILFAADPKNAFMTGETLAVDGGLTAI